MTATQSKPAAVMRTSQSRDLPGLTIRRPHLIYSLGAALLIGLFTLPAVAQTSTGTSTTSCTQSGTTMTCIATTQFALPTVVNLQSGSGQTTFALTTGPAGAPQCTGGLSAAPSSVNVGVATPITLTLVGCPSSGVSYAWQSPAVPNTNPAGAGAAHTLTLAATGSTQPYSVIVCSVVDANSCSTYSASVTAVSTTPPPLAGCTVSGAPTASVAIGSTPTLSVQCSQGTIQTAQWSLNGNAIAQATGISYAIPAAATTAGSTLNYSVALTGTGGSQGAASATITVVAASGTSCTTSGTPGTTFNFSAPFVGLNSIALGGRGAVYVIAINVGANDSTLGREYLPAYGATNSPVTGFGYRTVSVSTCPNDFTSSNAQIVAEGSYDFLVEFTTEPSRVRQGIALLQPGRTYYINVRNDTCPGGQICSLDGQYRNWGR